jgi:hypothetical protein
VAHEQTLANPRLTAGFFCHRKSPPGEVVEQQGTRFCNAAGEDLPSSTPLPRADYWKSISQGRRPYGRVFGDMRSAARIRTGCTVLAVFAGLQAIPGQAAQDSGATGLTATKAHRVYSLLLDPREHPDYDRRVMTLGFGCGV